MHAQAIMLAAIPVASGPQTASDNFDSYANGSLLSGQGHWTRLQSNFDLTVVKPAADGALMASNGNSGAQVHYYNTGTWSINQWSQITYLNDSPGAAVRCDSGTQLCYWCEPTTSFGGLVRLNIMTGFNNFNNITFGFCTVTAGDVWRIEVTGTGAATRITVKQNGSAILSNVDPGAGNYLSTGVPGVTCSNQSSAAVDNWSASDI